MSREAMQKAAEALRQALLWTDEEHDVTDWRPDAVEAMEALRAAIAQPEAVAVAWYVERVAPGFMDHGRRQGPYWSKDVAESYVDERHVLRPLYAVALPGPAAQPNPPPAPRSNSDQTRATNSTAHTEPTNATWERKE